MKTPLVATLALLTTGCMGLPTHEDRIDRLENRVNFVYEIVRKRKLSAEWCANYTDDDMRCKISDFGVCACEFRPDAMDIENAKIAAAAEKLNKAKEGKEGKEEKEEKEEKEQADGED
jgi:hypothetical protein